MTIECSAIARSNAPAGARDSRLARPPADCGASGALRELPELEPPEDAAAEGRGAGEAVPVRLEAVDEGAERRDVAKIVSDDDERDAGETSDPRLAATAVDPFRDPDERREQAAGPPDAPHAVELAHRRGRSISRSVVAATATALPARGEVKRLRPTAATQYRCPVAWPGCDEAVHQRAARVEVLAAPRVAPAPRRLPPRRPPGAERP
jgi:autotransporter translocation and assembly factor TamB